VMVTVVLPLWPLTGVSVKVQLPAAVQVEAPVMLAAGSSVALELVAVTVSVPVPASVKTSLPAVGAVTVTLPSPLTVGDGGTMEVFAVWARSGQGRANRWPVARFGQSSPLPRRWP